MINKKSIWFLTLFSLILVLSVYYITMPSELLLNTNANYNKDKEPTVEIKEMSEADILNSISVDNSILELDDVRQDFNLE